MPKAPTTTLTLMVELKLKPGKGQTRQEAQEQFTKLFGEYLENPEGAFIADYGPKAWGGYPGPFVKGSAVTLVPELSSKETVQLALDTLAEEIVENGQEMLGDSVFDESQWHALAQVATALNLNLTTEGFQL